MDAPPKPVQRWCAAKNAVLRLEMGEFSARNLALQICRGDSNPLPPLACNVFLERFVHARLPTFARGTKVRKYIV
jgi:hypothetical protein